MAVNDVDTTTATVKALLFRPDSITEVSVPVVVGEETREVSFAAVRPLIGARLVEANIFAEVDGVDLVLLADEEGLLVSDPVLNRPFRDFTARSVGVGRQVAGSVLLVGTGESDDVDLPDRLLTEARELPAFCEEI
jgi:hypothetical protein